MKASPWLVAAGIAGLLYAFEPSRREVRRVINGTARAARSSVSNALPTSKPKSATTSAPKTRNANDALPVRLEPYRKAFERASDGNGVRLTLLGAVSERENRNADPYATRLEPGLLIQPWFAAAAITRGGGLKLDQLATSYGLMQLLGITATAELGWKGTAAKLSDPVTNVELATRYLARCIARQRGVMYGLVMYNGGPGAVQRVKDGDLKHPSFEYAKDVIARERRIRAEYVSSA